MGGGSWSSVEIISVDLPGIRQALAEYISDLSRRPEVIKVVVFGSMVTKRYAPGSDLDVLIVISSSPKPFQSRIPDYLPTQFPMDLDAFPYTEDELDRLPFPKEALAGGRVVWERGMKSPINLSGIG